MTVKIKDKVLFDKYLSAKKYMNNSNISLNVYNFLGHVGKPDPIDEVQAVVNAIFNGEDVELDEQKYWVSLPHLTGNNGAGIRQLYLVKNKTHDVFETDCFPISDADQQIQLTMNEIPKCYRQFAQKVED